jgi:hypothetical protein
MRYAKQANQSLYRSNRRLVIGKAITEKAKAAEAVQEHFLFISDDIFILLKIFG